MRHHQEAEAPPHIEPAHASATCIATARGQILPSQHANMLELCVLVGPWDSLPKRALPHPTSTFSSRVDLSVSTPCHKRTDLHGNSTAAGHILQPCPEISQLGTCQPWQEGGRSKYKVAALRPPHLKEGGPRVTTNRCFILGYRPGRLSAARLKQGHEKGLAAKHRSPTVFAPERCRRRGSVIGRRMTRKNKSLPQTRRP